MSGLPLTTLAEGADSGVVTPRRAVARDPAAWRALWAAHAGPASTAPAVDFATTMVAAVFAGERPDPGHGIRIAGARAEAGGVAVLVEEAGPHRGMAAAQILVSPFHIVTLPRVDGEVRFTVPGEPGAAAGARPAAAGDAPPIGRPEAAPSSTGLEPSFAAALAYLAGPLSGLLILMVERSNRFVRFHAWQAVVGLGGLAALAIAALICSFLTLLLSPVAFTIMYRLSAAAAVAWVAAWVWCLVTAFTGRTSKLPLAGGVAERLAAGPLPGH